MNNIVNVIHMGRRQRMLPNQPGNRSMIFAINDIVDCLLT